MTHKTPADEDSSLKKMSRLIIGPCTCRCHTHDPENRWACPCHFVHKFTDKWLSRKHRRKVLFKKARAL